MLIFFNLFSFNLELNQFPGYGGIADLLMKYGANVNSGRRRGKTVLHTAIENGISCFKRYLIDYR